MTLVVFLLLIGILLTIAGLALAVANGLRLRRIHHLLNFERGGDPAAR